MISADQAKVFFWSGLVWQGVLRAYWVSLVVRLTIELDLTNLQLVLLGTAMETALLVSEIPTGVVADLFSRKWSIIIGFVAVGVAQIASGLVEPFSLLILTQISWGVGYTFRSGADTAWITDELGGAERVEPLLLRRARYQLLVSIGSIAFGAALARLTSLSTSVVAGGIVLIATGLVLGVVMTEDGFERVGLRRDATAGTLVRGTAAGLRASTEAFSQMLRAGAATVRASGALRTLVFVLVLTGIGSEAVDRLDIRRLDNIGLSADFDEIVVVGVVLSAEAALGALVLLLGRHRMLGVGVVTAIASLLALSALGVAVLGLVAALPVAVVGLVGQGGLRTAAQSLSVNWTNAHAPSSVRATVHSFIEQANSLGEITGGVLLGAVAALTTVPTAMAVSAVLLVAAAIVATRGRRAWPTAGSHEASAVRS